MYALAIRIKSCPWRAGKSGCANWVITLPGAEIPVDSVHRSAKPADRLLIDQRANRSCRFTETDIFRRTTCLLPVPNCISHCLTFRPLTVEATLRPITTLLLWFAQVCHVVRAAVGYSALLSTLYYLALFVKHRRLRTTLNWAVCNLLVSNGLLAIVIAIFSTLKAINPNSLSSLRGCLSFTWVITFLSFGPSWSVALMALTRAVHYSNVPTLDQVLSLRTLGMLRTFTVLLDAIMTSLILHRKAALVAPTHCTYQLMLEASDVHMIYTLVIILLLVAAGLSALSLRIRRRRQMLANRDIPNPSSTGSAEKPVHQSVPVNIFKKPMMMSTGVLLVSLFALPRVAFFVDCTELWQISTLCPVVIALILPPIFIYYTKDFRSILRSYQWRCASRKLTNTVEQ